MPQVIDLGDKKKPLLRPMFRPTTIRYRKMGHEVARTFLAKTLDRPQDLRSMYSCPTCGFKSGMINSYDKDEKLARHMRTHNA